MTRALLLAVLLAGCAPLVWTRPGTTPEQARLDAGDCQQRAWQEAQFRGLAYGPGPRLGRRDPFLNDPFSDETRFARFCMEARGYRLQAQPRL